ncbi:MAG: hypothetical protein ACRCSP_01560, partial [Rhodoglobus sp.]
MPHATGYFPPPTQAHKLGQDEVLWMRDHDFKPISERSDNVVIASTAARRITPPDVSPRPSHASSLSTVDHPRSADIGERSTSIWIFTNRSI